MTDTIVIRTKDQAFVARNYSPEPLAPGTLDYIVKDGVVYRINDQTA